MSKPKILNLKMGGRCNLQCPHCHCEPSDYEFNPDIIPFINRQKYDRITFGGGEPLLYLTTVKKLLNLIEPGPVFRMVTNGTLLTKEVAEYLNHYSVNVIVSYDGEQSQRDRSSEPNWQAVRFLKNSGLSVCCYPGNMGFAKLGDDIEALKRKHNLGNIQTPGVIHHVCFLHQTDYALNDSVSEDDVESYISQFQVQLDYLFNCYCHGRSLSETFLLRRALQKWYTVKSPEGVACCNSNVHALTLDGRFILCAYGHHFVGDIYSGLDLEKVASYVPERCRHCELWHRCKNTCIANVTENECKISKAMCRYLQNRLNELGIKERVENELAE